MGILNGWQVDAWWEGQLNLEQYLAFPMIFAGADLTLTSVGMALTSAASFLCE